MAIDYRERITDAIVMEAFDFMPSEQVEAFKNRVVMILGKYEITEQCTDLIIYDDANERLLKRYVGCLRIDGKSEKTIYQYIRSCRALAKTIGKKFTEMGVYDIRMFLAMEKERGIKNTTLENTRANLSAFFQWLTLEEEIPKNPCMKVKPIKCAKEVKLPFSDIEIDTLRSACKTPKERALIEFLLASGVRVSELAQMNVEDVNFQEMRVHVRHGKGNKERITYISPVAKKHVADYLESRKQDHESLFCSKRGGRLTTSGIQHILKQLEARSGVANVHPHRFRRTFATKLAARGMDVQEIKTLLGHSDINTTMKYVYVNDVNIKTSYSKYSA